MCEIIFSRAFSISYFCGNLILTGKRILRLPTRLFLRFTLQSGVAQSRTNHNKYPNLSFQQVESKVDMLTFLLFRNGWLCHECTPTVWVAVVMFWILIALFNVGSEASIAEAIYSIREMANGMHLTHRQWPFWATTAEVIDSSTFKDKKCIWFVYIYICLVNWIWLLSNCLTPYLEINMIKCIN